MKSLPNIIVIVVDDLRWDELGVTGHNYIKTSNIDRLALEGGLFRNAFTTTPLCSPARASILTGQYAHNHGIIDNTERGKLSHQLATFPAKLNSMGYDTAFLGKWQMGNDDTPRPGFDFWAALKGQGRAYNPQLNVNGTYVNSKGYITDTLTDYSIKFIGQKRNTPFLLFLAEKGLHPDLKQDKEGHVHKIDGGGFIPAKKDKGIYEDAVFNRRFNAYVTPYDKPALMRKIDELPTLGHRTATLEKIIRRRAEMLMSIDEGVGKIKKTLKEIGKLDDTIIILTSDHGYWYGEHGLGRERRLAYEEGIRIPMLVRYPPLVKKGTTYDQLALNIDLAPTLIELAGGKPDNSIDGKSWISFLTDPGYKNWRSSFLIEYYSDHVWPRTVNLGYKTIRTERYKYIQYNKLDGMNEFYDLEKDPYELTNQINNPNYKRTLNRMQNKLIQYLHD